VKIGVTSDVPARLLKLQCAHHKELRVLGTVKGDRYREIMLHERWQEHRIRGEWFRLHWQIEEYIKRHATP
jgi:hypothetical protein